MSRLEHNFLGELTIDDSVYYGVQTLRAMNNFHISGTPLSQFPEMIWALACVKKACALANMELQVLPRDIGIAICAACDRILAGNMLDQWGRHFHEHECQRGHRQSGLGDHGPPQGGL